MLGYSSRYYDYPRRIRTKPKQPDEMDNWGPPPDDNWGGPPTDDEHQDALDHDEDMFKKELAGQKKKDPSIPEYDDVDKDPFKEMGGPDGPGEDPFKEMGGPDEPSEEPPKEWGRRWTMSE